METFFLKGSYETFLDLFFQASKQIIFSAPNISNEIAEALVAVQERGVDVHVFLEFKEESYRAGYGDIKAINTLREKNIPVINKSGFNVYFVIIDSSGFFYFPKNWFFEKEGDAFDLFVMNQEQVKALKLIYKLPDRYDDNFDDLIEAVGLRKLTEVGWGFSKIEDKEAMELTKKLEKEPVLQPEFGRVLEVYRAKFQIVELKFSGSNLHIKKIKLPRKALPFKDEKLLRAIEASLRLFTDIPEKEFFQPFFDLKTFVDVVRQEFLYHIKAREKNLIKKVEKEEFEEVLKELKDRVEHIKSDLINNLQKEIISTREQIFLSLKEFLKANPPEELSSLEGDVLEGEAAAMANRIVSKISFPSAKSLLNEIKLDFHYYDLTWEDLNNKEVLKEMIDLRLIGPEDKIYFDELAIKASPTN